MNSKRQLDTDVLLITRGGVSYNIEVKDMSAIQDDDLLLISRSGTSYKITGADFKSFIGGGGSPLSPALPPFTAESYLDMVVSNDEGELVFSLDKENWSASLNVPINTVYWVDWTDDIMSKSQGSSYETVVKLNYPDIPAQQTVDIEIASLNKVPDQITFAPQEDVYPGDFYEANTTFPIGYNAPGWIWVDTNSPEVQVNIDRAGWVNPPTSSGSMRIGPNEELLVKHTAISGTLGVTTTTVNIGYGTGDGEHMSSDFVTTNSLAAVDTPSIISPTEGEGGLPANPELVSSSYHGIGSAEVQGSASWQVSTTSDFSVITAESIDDTENLESWIVTPALEWNTTYYCRVQHTAVDNTLSDWSDVNEITTADPLPAFQNGSTFWDQRNFRPVNWTVPDRIFRVRAHLEGSQVRAGNAQNFEGPLGGTVEVEFDVVPGEIFRLGAKNPDSVSLLLAKDTPDPDDPEVGPVLQQHIFAVVGQAGYTSYNMGMQNLNQSAGGKGGAGGGDFGDQAPDPGGQGRSGGGGTQTEGGATRGSTGCTNCENPGWSATAGGPLSAGSGGMCITGPAGSSNSSQQTRRSGGSGGSGWFGGAGGDSGNSSPGGGGGGGSSKIQVPESRNPVTLENSKGTGRGKDNAGPQPFIQIYY